MEQKSTEPRFAGSIGSKMEQTRYPRSPKSSVPRSHVPDSPITPIAYERFKSKCAYDLVGIFNFHQNRSDKLVRDKKRHFVGKKFSDDLDLHRRIEECQHNRDLSKRPSTEKVQHLKSDSDTGAEQRKDRKATNSSHRPRRLPIYGCYNVETLRQREIGPQDMVKRRPNNKIDAVVASQAAGGKVHLSKQRSDQINETKLRGQAKEVTGASVIDKLMDGRNESRLKSVKPTFFPFKGMKRKLVHVMRVGKRDHELLPETSPLHSSIREFKEMENSEEGAGNDADQNSPREICVGYGKVNAPSNDVNGIKLIDRLRNSESDASGVSSSANRPDIEANSSGNLESLQLVGAASNNQNQRLDIEANTSQNATDINLDENKSLQVDNLRDEGTTEVKDSKSTNSSDDPSPEVISDVNHSVSAPASIGDCSCSPSSIHEVDDFHGTKDSAEQTSPESALESFSCEENTTSPLSTQSHSDQNLFLPSRTSAGKQRLESKIHSNASLEEHGSTFEFITAILQLSGLDWDQLLLKWHSADQILDKSLLNELDSWPNELPADNRLLFDYLNEVLAEPYLHYSRCSPWLLFAKSEFLPITASDNLINRTMKLVDWSLIMQSNSSMIEQIVERDLAKSGTWLDIRIYADEIVSELVETIIQEMIPIQSGE